MGWRKKPPPQPLAEIHEITVEQKDGHQPRLVTVDEVEDWFTASEERERLVFVQMESVLDALAPRWPRRIKMFRRELAWVREAAAEQGLDWGRDAR